jgi:hypothetical protein
MLSVLLRPRSSQRHGATKEYTGGAEIAGIDTMNLVAHLVCKGKVRVYILRPA